MTMKALMIGLVAVAAGILAQSDSFAQTNGATSNTTATPVAAQSKPANPAAAPSIVAAPAPVSTGWYYLPAGWYYLTPGANSTAMLSIPANQPGALPARPALKRRARFPRTRQSRPRQRSPLSRRPSPGRSTRPHRRECSPACPADAEYRPGLRQLGGWARCRQQQHQWQLGLSALRRVRIVFASDCPNSFLH